MSKSVGQEWCPKCGCGNDKAGFAHLDGCRMDTEKLEEEIERLRDVLVRIKKWQEAYPCDIFPEPDFKRVHEILLAAGLTLDAISASNMRHVLNGIKEIVDDVLEGSGDCELKADGHKPSVLSDLLCCNICGSALTEIRGRYPRGPRRKVCATCLQEKLERIHDETSADYGKACQDGT